MLAQAPTRVVVVEHSSGGTPWWVPVLVGIAAAAASYYATWRFRRADVNRENAVRAADLVDQAERVASFGGEPLDAHRALQQARVRAEPLDDDDLDNRMRAALDYTFEVLSSLDADRQQGLGRQMHWLREAVANVRAGLVPHLSAPKLLRRSRPTSRSFPTMAELSAMERGQSSVVLIEQLVTWRAEQTPER